MNMSYDFIIAAFVITVATVKFWQSKNGSNRVTTNNHNSDSSSIQSRTSSALK